MENLNIEEMDIEVNDNNPLHDSLVAFLNRSGWPRPVDEYNPLIIARLHDCKNGINWWVTEYCERDHIAFSYVTDFQYDEWGSVSLDELCAANQNGASHVVVDPLFEPLRFDEMRDKKAQGYFGAVKPNQEASHVEDVPINMEVLGLSDFIADFGEGLLEAVREQNPPVYDGKADPKRAEVMAGLKRVPFDAQQDVVQAICALFDRGEPAGIINAEMGTGKTMMAIATSAVLSSEGYNRTLVICPPHLVYKWRREIKETVQNAKVWILNGPDTLRKLLHIRAIGTSKPTVPEYFILGRVRMRLGYYWKPAFVSKKLPLSNSSYACCPDCFSVIEDETGEPLLSMSSNAEDVLSKTQRFCNKCKAALWTLYHPKQVRSHKELVFSAMQQIPSIGEKTADKLLRIFGEDLLGSMLEDNVYEFINLMDEKGELIFSDNQATRMERAMAKNEFSFGHGGYQPTEFIKRYLPQNFFDLLVVDEGHEFKNAGSAQGQAFGVLTQKCRKTLLLTGTLMGGYAEDIFYLLWRLNPSRMISDGFIYRKGLGSAAMSFNRAHGVLKDVYKKPAFEDGDSHRTSRGRQVVHRINKAPGFGPKGIMRYVVPITAFLRLKDIGEGILPAYKEHFLSINMSEPQQAYYNLMQQKLKDALVNALRGGDHSLLGVVLNALLAWPECCFRPEVVKHPHKKIVLADMPEIFDNNTPTPKEENFIELCRAEKAKGRRVLGYTVYTGTRDTTTRIESLLKVNGLKVAVLRSTVKAEKREDWLLDQVDRGVDVVLTNPELVKTGLDMLAFPCIVFLQSGYNVYTLQQASRRSWRIGQKNDVDVFFLGYEQTAQMSCLELMAKKIAVSQSTSGDIPDSGLDILNQGGDSIEVELAKRLVA